MATDVATSFPQLSLPSGATITVTLDDAAAKITKLNVWALNLGTGQIEDIAAVPVVLPYVPQDPP